MYNHILFDIDGTLLDSEQTGMQSLQMTIKDFTGRDLSFEEVLPYFGLPSKDVSSRIGVEDAYAFGVKWEEHFQELMYLSKIFPGITDTLKKLKEDGKSLSIITSRNHVEIQYDPMLAQLLPYFDFLFGSDDTERPKPFPDPILEYIRRTGAKKEECIYLGDTPHDYFCARDAGVDFALADWKHRGCPDSVEAKFIFHSASEILENI